MPKSKDDGEITLLVKFSNVNVGDKTVRLGCAIDRKQLSLARADKTFCDRRLDLTVSLGTPDEAENQTKLIEDADYEVSGAADVKGVKVSVDEFKIGLTFSKAEISIEDLSRFASGSGRLLIRSADDIPEEPKPEPPIKGSAQPIPRAAKGKWRSVKLDTVFDPEKTICKALANAGIETVGQLADYTATKRLEDIDGLGPKKIEELQGRMVEFWKVNPDADAQEELAGAAANA